MLRTRLLSAAVLLPVVICCVFQGGEFFNVLIAVWLSVAGAEFWRLTSSKNFHPALGFLLGMIWLFLLDAHLVDVDLLEPGLLVLLLVSLAWQIFRRKEASIAGWALSVAGGVYLGVCGACWVKLRQLEPDGLWWVLIILTASILADTGAYFVGHMWGRRALAPTVSPGKTWEGYLGGVVIGGVSTGLLAVIIQSIGGTDSITGLYGFVFGFVVAVFAPFGDLVISMVKREAGVKDSGHIIPGHGGALDRIDSMLWAGAIGYCLILCMAIL